jgi:hypothetical protein
MPSNSSNASNYWIADTAISMPAAPTTQRPVVFEFVGTGFGLTTGGLVVVISEADRDEMMSTHFGPPGGVP